MLKNPLVLAFIASLFFGIWPIPLKLAISSGPAPDVVIWVGTGITIGGCVWKFFEGGSLSYSWSLIWNSTFGGIIYTAGLGYACGVDLLQRIPKSLHSLRNSRRSTHNDRGRADWIGETVNGERKK